MSAVQVVKAFNNMHTIFTHLRKNTPLYVAAYPVVLLAIGSMVVLFGWVSRTNALFVNPSSPPPGGVSSIPLNSSDTAQTKIGSLVLGAYGIAGCNSSSTIGCAKLCLNSRTGSSDNTKCISSWGGLQGIGDTGLLKLNTVPGIVAPQQGYVYLSGDANDPHATLNITVSLGINAVTALYAEGNSIDNYAGYFSGDVQIEKASTEMAGKFGHLCLNGTGTRFDHSTDSNNGYYCISQWTDLSATVADKLTLQASAAPMTEYGSVGIAQAFNSGSVVLGDASYVDVSNKCGDGMCDSAGANGKQENSNVGDPGYCPIDCGTPLSPSAFTATAAASPTVHLSVTAIALAQPVALQVLVVRSTDPNSPFIPQDGITYTPGGTSAFAIVYAGSVTAGTPVAITDSTYGITAGTKYYYRAFQANLFPKYGPAISKTVTTN